MVIKNTHEQYGGVSKFFHWFMALLIVGLLIVGLLMTGMEKGPDKLAVYGVHKSIGIVVLILAFARISWKCMNITPSLPDTLAGWQKKTAKLGHLTLYGFMFMMPLSGWAMSSAAGYPVSVFGWFTMPSLVSPGETARDFFKETHELLADFLMVMLAAHVLAALLHHFYYRDTVLKRMLPFNK